MSKTASVCVCVCVSAYVCTFFSVPLCLKRVFHEHACPILLICLFVSDNALPSLCVRVSI